jgi:hypothetical protein
VAMQQQVRAVETLHVHLQSFDLPCRREKTGGQPLLLVHKVRAHLAQILGRALASAQGAKQKSERVPPKQVTQQRTQGEKRVAGTMFKHMGPHVVKLASMAWAACRVDAVVTVE